MKRNFAFWLHYPMRLRPTYSAFLLFVCFALVSTISVNAQEDRPQPEIEAAVRENLRNDPDPVLFETERMGNKSTPTPATTKEITRDSIQVKTLKPAKSTEKVEKEEDPLSFNFLYYIIEKFKMSDIIE